MKAPVNLQHPFGPLLHCSKAASTLLNQAASILLNQGAKTKENAFKLTFCQVEGLGPVHGEETGTMISDADSPVQFSNNIYTHKKTYKQFITEVKQLGIYYFKVKVNQTTS